MNAIVPDNARPVMLAGGRIQPIIPQSMEDAYRLGTAICKAGMAPRGMEQPEKCMIAILRGLEVGLTPMQALDKIAVVNGRPTIWGDGAMALVRGSGLCEFVDERIDGEGDKRVAVCETKRKGEPGKVVRRFSVADAKEAGLWGKTGPWKQFPARMLQMRARAFALRDLYADVLGGLYLREEIEEEDRRRHNDPPPAPRISASEPPPAPRTINHQPSQNTAQEGKPAPVQGAEAASSHAPAATQASASDQSEHDEDGVITFESLLMELDDRLRFARTAEEVEEAYTDFDAEPLFADYENGVEAARALKAKHLDRVEESAKPADDFPGNDGLAALQNKAETASADPFEIPETFKGGGAYQVRVRKAIAATQAPDDEDKLRAFWGGTASHRQVLSDDGQLVAADIATLKNEVIAALERVCAMASGPEDASTEASEPPPAPPQARREAEAAPPSPPASDDPVAAYTTRMEAAFAQARTQQDVDKFWYATTDVRDEETGATEEQRAKWRLARRKAKNALPSAEG